MTTLACDPLPIPRPAGYWQTQSLVDQSTRRSVVHNVPDLLSTWLVLTIALAIITAVRYYEKR